MNPSLIRPLVLGARAALFAAAVVVLTACAGFGGAPSPARVADGVFVSAAGMTLYTFDRDTASSGKSVCNGPCAVNWPPPTPAPAATGA